jgi:hypothetical protein
VKRRRGRRRPGGRPNAPNGSVGGLVAAAADELITRVVWRLARESEGGRFQMATALALFQDAGVKDPRILEAFRGALENLPGLRRGKGRGEYVLPPNPVAYARNRSWKLALGRANLADAVALRDALNRLPEKLHTPHTVALLGRLEAAATPLLKEES